MPRARPKLPILHLSIPDNLDLQRLSVEQPPQFTPFKLDVCAVILHTIYRRMYRKQKRRDKGWNPEYVRLCSTYLKQNIHRDAAKFIHWLCSTGVLVTDGRFQPGHFAKGYRFGETYRHQRIRQYRCTDLTTIRKFLTRRRKPRPTPTRVEPAPSTPPPINIRAEIVLRAADRCGLRMRGDELMSRGDVLSAASWYAKPEDDSHSLGSMCSGLTRYQFYHIPASEWSDLQRCPNNVEHFCTVSEAKRTERALRADLESVTLRDGWRGFIQQKHAAGEWDDATANHADMTCQAIEDRLFRIWRDTTAGRLHTNVTGLKKELRPFLRLRGCADLAMLDLRASQPYLLAGLMRWRSRDNPREHALVAAADEWATFVTREHDPYAAILGLTTGRPVATVSKPERDAAKSEVMRLLFSHPKQRQPFKEAFEECFPQVARFVRELKRDGYNECAILLQRYEAEIMIGAVSEQLVAAGIPVLTVHDCAIVRAQDADTTERILKAEFGRVVGTPPITVRATVS